MTTEIEQPELNTRAEAQVDSLLSEFKGLKNSVKQAEGRIAEIKAKVEAIFDNARIPLDGGYTMSTGDRVTRVRGKRKTINHQALVKKGYITTSQLAEVTTEKEATPFILITVAEEDGE